MPESKKRKKNGKKVGNGEAARLKRFDDMESGVSFQDLINVLAYQESHEPQQSQQDTENEEQN